MTTFNTGNPIGSVDPRDLYDNAENLDTAVNTKTDTTWTDRLGVERKTFHGMETQFDNQQVGFEDRFQETLLKIGYEQLGDYADGLVITEYNQIFRHEGEWWRAAATTELPYTTTGDWGEEEGLFVAVGDAALRQELVNTNDSNLGAALIGRAKVVVKTITDLLLQPQKTDLVFSVLSFHESWAGGVSAEIGGGDFIWNPNMLKSSHNGGTVVSPTVPWDGAQAGLSDFLDGVGETDVGGNGCFVRLCGTTYDATWFGARPNTTVNYAYNDTKSFQSCLQAIYDELGQRGGFMTMPTGNYVIDGQLDIVVSKVSVDFNRSFLWCRDAAPNTRILYVTGDLDGWKQDHQNINEIKNGVLVGDYAGAQAETFQADAIVFEQEDAADPSGPAFLRINGMAIDGFRNGIEIRSNSYLLRFTDCQIGGCGIGLHVPHGYENYGEAITFRNSNFQACLVDVKADAWSADLFFDTCSFDFTNGTWLELGGKATADYFGCHFEQVSYDDYLFKISNQGSCNIVGGTMYVQAGPELQYDHLIHNTVLADTDGGITFDGVWFYNVRPKYAALSVGTGRTILRNSRGVDFSYLASRNTRNNLLKDPSFESGVVQGLIAINYDTGPGGALSGDTLTLETSTEKARSGSRSLKITKKNAATNKSFVVAAPINQQRVAATFFMSRGSYTGNILIEYGHAILYPARGERLVADFFVRDASYTVDNTTLTESWSEFFAKFRPTPAPSWATHVVIMFTPNGAGTGSFYIDDFYMQTL